MKNGVLIATLVNVTATIVTTTTTPHAPKQQHEMPTSTTTAAFHTLELVAQQVQLLEGGQVRQGVGDAALQLILLHVESLELAQSTELGRNRSRQAVMTQA